MELTWIEKRNSWGGTTYRTTAPNGIKMSVYDYTLRPGQVPAPFKYSVYSPDGNFIASGYCNTLEVAQLKAIEAGT